MLSFAIFTVLRYFLCLGFVLLRKAIIGRKVGTTLFLNLCETCKQFY